MTQDPNQPGGAPPPEDAPPRVAAGPGLGPLFHRMPPPLRYGIPVLVILAIVGGTVLLQRSSGSNSSSGQTDGVIEYGPLEAKPPRKGEPAPDFALPLLDGGSVRLSELRGKPVLLNFWATWCGPCKAEMPDIQAAYTAANGDLVVLAVNVEGTSADRARSLAQDYRDLNGYTYPMALDSPDGDVQQQYRLKGLPDSFFIDRNGVVQDVVLGPLSKDDLQKKLSALLAK